MINITPRTWYQVSASRLDSVAPSPSMPGIAGVAGVMDAWSGGAFDTLRDKLMVWGGGHTDYAGNEIYGFSLSALSWQRIREPVSAGNVDSGSPGTFESTGYYANGLGSYDPQQPRARHTYSTLQYHPIADKFIAFGSQGMYQGGQTDTSHTFIYNISANNWTSGLDVPTPFYYTMPTGYDSVTSGIWMYGGASTSFLTQYFPLTNTWGNRGDASNGNELPVGNEYLTGVVDPVRRRFFAMGNGACLFWPLSGSGNVDVVNITSRAVGVSGLINVNAPGLEYDPISQCIVGWAGGSTIYVFDTNTFVCSAVPLSLSNTVTPTNANNQGTFGRFRYSPTSNVYVVVNATNENVYLFKLNADPNTNNTITPNVISASYSIQSPQINRDFVVQNINTLSASYSTAPITFPALVEISSISRRLKF